MERRLSPAFPCICGGRDWSFDETLLRWMCNDCIKNGRPIPPRPEFDQVTDFEAFYDKVMDDWETINHTIREDTGPPENPRDLLIYKARHKKIMTELLRTQRLADIATYISTMKQYSKTGDVYVNLPEFDMEVRFQW